VKLLTFLYSLISWECLTDCVASFSLQVSGRSQDSNNTDVDCNQGHGEGTSGVSNHDFKVAGNHGPDAHTSRLATKTSDEFVSKGSSGVASETNCATASWALSMQSPSLPSQPLMPFEEWNIEFSELRIGVRVGIGWYF
jgi:hypothetical protein